jgi:hypothetical protein
LLIAGMHKVPGADVALKELAALETLAENWRERALRFLA